MPLLDYSELMPLDKFSRIDSAIKSTKDHINWREMDRVAAILKTLKDDEVRLTKCIDDIEVFHRDMFVLPNKENKPVDTENAPAIKGDMNETEYSVTEPQCSENEPMHSMNEPNFSMNEQNSSRRRLILKFPKSRINNIFNESDHSYVSISMNDSGGGLVDVMDESGDGMEESGDGMEESSDGMEESSDGKEESSDGKEESSDGKEESSDGKEESSDDDEMAKKVLLNLLADKEKEVTELVLHLIYTFSCFQSRLRKAETSVSLASRIIPGKSRSEVKRTLNSLSGSVLHLDKTTSKIYEKYSEMLQSLGKIFE